MPEGDTIWRTAASLRQRLLGRRLVRALPAQLEGTRVEEVEPLGKHLLIRFEGGWTLHSHLRMSGVWDLYRPGERWRKPEHRARAVLETDDAVAVCFSAPVVELTRQPRERLGHLGPDILAASFLVDQVIARARARPKPLGELLLDQSVCAGIGNVYKCEALWACRLDPWKPSSAVEDAVLAELFGTARAAMRANLGAYGFRRRFPGQGRGAVHGRRGRPCSRCGTPIAAQAQGEHARITFWCPGCQA